LPNDLSETANSSCPLRILLNIPLNDIRNLLLVLVSSLVSETYIYTWNRFNIGTNLRACLKISHIFIYCTG
jgi:hypothetical protein